MDVGLRNMNFFEDKELQDVEFLVKANSNEYFFLWKEWAEKSLSNIKPIPDEIMEVCLGYISFTSPFYKTLKEHNEKIKLIKTHRVKWEEIGIGLGLSIGDIKIKRGVKYEKYEVWVDFRFAIINGHKVGFYCPGSRFSDITMINDYLSKKFERTHDNYSRSNFVDAANFHNCVNSLDNIDKEPRPNAKRKKF